MKEAPVQGVPGDTETRVGATSGLDVTVTGCTAEAGLAQPPVTTKLMLVFPSVSAVTTPLASTLATAGLLLTHEPMPVPPESTPATMKVSTPARQSVLKPVTEPTTAFG